MVFSPIHLYLDHSNWQQHQQQQQQQQQQLNDDDQLHGNGFGSPHQLPPPPPPARVGGGAGSIRPGSMVDRARIAKLPLPEAGLKCPRCESTNTKFCYFNNYNLSQPRHFCKTCRRYWTRGGSLRNVPVGGGSRRNKRNKSKSNSKSSVVCTDRRAVGSNLTYSNPSDSITDMAFHDHLPRPGLQSTLMSPLFQDLTHYNASNIGSNIGLGFHVGNNPNDLSTAGGILDQWRLPFLAGLEPSIGLFPDHTAAAAAGPPSAEFPSFILGENHLHPISTTTNNSGITQLTSLKLEQNDRCLNLSSSSRQFLGSSESHQQWGGGNSWTEISALSSDPSTNNFA